MAYMPTSSSSEEELEAVYERVEEAVKDSKAKHKILIGDFNAKIGTNDKDNSKCMGPHGVGSRNRRGERLIEFAEEHQLVIANTLFKKPKNRYWTWESPDGNTKNMIDLALCNRRDIITNCEVITKADKGSDHRMIRLTIKINKKLERVKSINKLKPINIDRHKLLEEKVTFQLNLKNRFEKLANIDATTFCEIMNQEANELAKGGSKGTKEDSEEDIEIRKLEEKRKKLRNKANKTNIERLEYAEIRKTVKKKRRQRTRQRRKEHIESILEKGQGPKEVFKPKNKKVINEMKKENGEVVTNREDILKVCAEFYQALYASQNKNTTSNAKESPDNLEPPPFIEEEINKALKDMKNNKAPGIDQLTSDIIKLGGDEALKKIYKEILKNRKIPPE